MIHARHHKFTLQLGNIASPSFARERAGSMRALAQGLVKQQCSPDVTLQK